MKQRIWELKGNAKAALVLAMMQGYAGLAPQECDLPGHLRPIFARDGYARFVDVFTGDVWSTRWREGAGHSGSVEITSDRLYLVA